MTTRRQNIPRKGDIIINPKTQRPVKVGSRTWLKLVKDGLVEGRYSDPKELYEVKDFQNQEEIEAKINELNKTLPPNVQGVRGRGRYKNKIVKRRKQPSTREITQHTAKTAARAVSNNIENLTDCEDLEAQLENMIMSELLGTSRAVLTRPLTIPKRGRGRPKKKVEKYETQEAPEYDEPDEYDYTEYENYEYEE
jgi:hypothetical protein